MNILTINEVLANRAALELRPLGTYLDDHDAGRVPAKRRVHVVISGP